MNKHADYKARVKNMLPHIIALLSTAIAFTFSQAVGDGTSVEALIYAIGAIGGVTAGALIGKDI